jgi:DNA-binding MarR family transcriptional regulator
VSRTVQSTLVGKWRELLAQHAVVSGALEHRLQADHGIGLSEFETLDRLTDARCEKYRMSDLARDMYLSQSALSRAVARLERLGLISRCMCPDDRRGIFVSLTEAGVRLHAEARDTQQDVLAATLR